MTTMRMKIKLLQRGQTIPLLAVIVLVLGLMLAVGPSVAQATGPYFVSTTGNDLDDCLSSGTACLTIQAAVVKASIGDTINVAAGTYTENINITKNLTLLSTSGRAATTIQGVFGVGSLGTIVISGNTTAVRIGNAAQGFSIIGIDNGAPGIENAAIYFQGAHSGAVVQDNEIRAEGDHGLLTEYGVSISNFTITGNEFSGKTFTGSNPGGCGFVSQFSTPNVPRQLLVMGNGGGNAATASATNITFTDNNVTGTAGGSSTVSGCETVGQGNTLVTLDVANSTISGNTFAGTTARFGTSLRVRRPATTISSNVFSSNGLAAYTGQIYFENADTFTTSSLLANNTFDKAVYGDPNATHQVTIGVAIQPAIDGATAGATLNVAAGTYVGNVNVNKSLTLNGTQVDNAVGGRTPGDGSESTIQGQVTIATSAVEFNGFTVTNPGQNRAIFIPDSSPSHSDITIAYNIVDNVGGSSVTSSVKAVYLNKGPDNVSILNNQISNVQGDTKSTDAISVLDSASADPSIGLLIQGNTIFNVISGPTNPKGAYGVIINNGAGASGAQIINNSFSGLSGKWTHAVGLEGPTPDAVVFNNQFSNLSASGLDNSAIFFEANPVGGSVSVAFNQFNGSGFYGVAIHPRHLDSDWSGTPPYEPIDYVVNATNNWWGDASGPSGGSVDPNTSATAGGSGAMVGPSVRFDPWLGADTEETSTGNVSGSGTVSLPSGEVSASFTGGSATVMLAKYTGNPSTVGTFGNVGNYYDINVSGSVSGDSLEITLDAGGNTGNLYYYDGADWKLVKAPGVIAPIGNRYTFTLNNVNTEPLLSDLDGTAFGGLSPVVWVELAPGFNSATFGEGETVDVVVKAGWSALYGVDLSLKYGSGLDVTRVILGGTSTGANLYADAVSYNSSSGGNIRFAYSQRGDVVGHENNVDDSSITLATITFLAKNEGASVQDVYLDGTVSPLLFSDKDGNNGAALTPDVVGDNPLKLNVIASPDVFVNVSLQGRILNWDGTYLKLSPLSGESGNVLFDNQHNSGLLEIDPVPANSNPPSAKTYNVRLAAPKYLAAVRQVLVTPGTDDSINLITVELRGGDINGDDQINIQDLVIIGVNFNATGSNNADINGDAGVNIQDLAIAAGNFGLETEDSDNAYPAPWQ